MSRRFFVTMATIEQQLQSQKQISQQLQQQLQQLQQQLQAVQQQPAPANNATSRVPIPQISPYLESEGAPPVGFKQWITMFNATVKLMEANQPQQSIPDSQKNLLLFTHLGTRGGKILTSSPLYGEMEAKSHTEFTEGVKSLFLPRQSSVKALHDFHQRVQRSSEPVDSFFTDLQSLLADCSLPKATDDQAAKNFYLMVQLVEGCYDLKTKQELLALINPSLDTVLQFMRAQETAKAEATAIVSSKPMGNTRIHKANAVNFSVTHKQCTGCGVKNAHSKRDLCLAWGKHHSCGKLGHFASLCKSKSQSSSNFSHNSTHLNYNPSKGKKIKSILSEIPILIQCFISATPNGLFKHITLEADSGAGPSTICLSRAKKIFGFKHVKFTNPSPVKNFDGTTIAGIVGTVQATVKYRNLIHSATFMW